MEGLCPCGHEPTGSIVPVSYYYYYYYYYSIIIIITVLLLLLQYYYYYYYYYRPRPTSDRHMYSIHEFTDTFLRIVTLWKHCRH